jgi:DNA-binding XRE family transcriptional regulator
MIPVPGVYMILSLITGGAYVGSSTNVAQRWKRHRESLLRGNHSNHALQAEWSIAGENGFVVTLLEPVTADDTKLDAAERRWAAWLRRANVPLYSTVDGGRSKSPPIILQSRLARFRLRAGLAQRDLAERSKVAASTIARIETGHEANPSTARRLAEALGCQPADLMEPEQS